MKNRRSKGVTFWAWIFIAFSILSILDVIINYRTRLQEDFGLFVYILLLAIAYLICGFFVLQLREPARKAVIYLGIISIMGLPFVLMSGAKAIDYDAMHRDAEKLILKETKPENQAAELESLRKNKERINKASQFVIMGLVGVPALLLEIIPIYFFTRPKVKEQFINGLPPRGTL